mmetsp:Transcript_17371/g.19800  ORF Transcript_17371/g.19800 Transcript_17371/m.19800 type:complete len:286 (+) Transcript_17371:41-898(+)|eukprot:CAMPEP_0176474522 /NCGR_PEP_ID=MMETSP0127-20121128/43038_1 /TAXON_ID=938130 /ORGANISM="Platyophrya macrostoma, Strain WH" /LENGTH=285 /DNA_ID=CAMNT_0017869897 /DNA_START=26 /DNA_END=883 /DNA_ORIENTATION=+
MYGQGLTGGFLMGDDGGNNDVSPDKGFRGNNNNMGDKNRKKSSIIPLTIKTVLDISNVPDDNIEVDGKPVVQVVILGRVLNTEEHPTRTVFSLDDTTGQLEIIYYKKNDEVPEMLTKLSLRKNMYLKAVVSIRPFKTKKIYVSTSMEEVTDYNQITYFMLNCFVAHAQRTQGYIQLPDDKENNPAATGNSKGKPYEAQSNNYNNNKGSMGMMESDSSIGGDPNSRLIKNCINKLQNETRNAVSFDQILEKFPGKFDPKTLRRHLDQLIQKGDIYTMDDDDHFRAI